MPNQVNVYQQVKDNNFLQIVGGNIVDKDNVIVSGLAMVPWAKFIVDSSDPAVGVDPTIACNYIISDREVYPGGGCPIFQINPLAVKKRSIISKYLYVPLFANRPLASDFPGLPIMIGNFGNAIAVSDGASYLSAYNQVVYSEQNGTLTTPTKVSSGAVTSFVFSLPCPNIPANLITPGKTIMRVNFSAMRINGGSVATLDLVLRLVTLGDPTSDPIADIYPSLSATDKVIVRQSSKLIFPTSAFFISNRANADVAAGTNQYTESSPTQWDITQPLIFSFRTYNKNSGDNLALIDFELFWTK